jgi:undecaprenyl-diphosphatase
VEHLIKSLAESLGQWAYLLVALMAMAETAAFLGFIAPGEFAVIFGGVLAGEGTLSIYLLIGLVWAAAVAGDSIGFVIGRRYGRAFAIKHGPKVRLTEERVRKVEEYFARHGGKTIILGRWVGFVRPLMPFTAGTSAMPYRRFIPYDVISAGLWTTTFTVLGYIFYRSFTQITNIASKGALAFGIALALLIGGYQAIKHLRDPEERRRFAAWMEQKPVLRPLLRFVIRPVGQLLTPPFRFARARLQPGTLGIEFTTLVAVAAVSIYVIVLQISLVQTGDPLISGDRWAWHLAHDINGPALTTLFHVITFLGTWWVVLTATLAVCAYLFMRERIAEAVTLASGYFATEITVHVMKAAVDRARPPDSIVDTNGAAYPSGHAAMAVTYLAIGVLLAREGPPPRRVALVLGGLALTVVIGLSRVYLRAHWLSDVGGGWAVGLAVFSICGCIALVVQYVRHGLGGTPAADASR